MLGRDAADVRQQLADLFERAGVVALHSVSQELESADRDVTVNGLWLGDDAAGRFSGVLLDRVLGQVPQGGEFAGGLASAPFKALHQAGDVLDAVFRRDWSAKLLTQEPVGSL